MKIDFHTHYSKEHFEALCKKARKLGLDGLVVEGIPYQESFSANGLTIFPAQEVEWTATLKTPTYNSIQDYYSRKRGEDQIDLFNGKALVLLPSENYKKLENNNLSELFKVVKDLNGVVIALQDEKTQRITSEGRIGNIYLFDAVRIRPFNEHDLRYEISSSRGSVAGSNATTPNELTYGKGFTQLEHEISSTEELIDYVKNKSESKLYIHAEKGKIDIKETVGGRK